MCVDDDTLERLADDELCGPALLVVQQHLSTCDRCAGELCDRQARNRSLRIALGLEDEQWGESSVAVLDRVEGALLRLRKPRRRIVSSWLRLSIAAVLLSISLSASHWVLAPSADLTAAAGVILEAARVRESAWTYQPGKVLHWVVDEDITGNKTLPDGHYRTLHWVSNLQNSDASVLRKYDDRGELVFATWQRKDGSEVVYRRSARAPLVIHQPVATVRAQLESLPPADRPGVERFLDLREADGDGLLARRERFVNWFLRSATASTSAVVHRTRTDSGSDGYYIRTESSPARVADVRKIVLETYIDGQHYRRVRQRSTREHTDGSLQVQEARWTNFSEVSPREFERHTLTDLIARIQPVTMNAAAIAKLYSRR